jgi:HEPN domain-containing protein
MTPECRDASDAHEWLRRARSNFARAAADPGHPDILLEDLCFDAQQAAVSPDVSVATDLTTHAVESRYPGMSESVSREEWIEAVASADRVLRWAQAVIGRPGN